MSNAMSGAFSVVSLFGAGIGAVLAGLFALVLGLILSASNGSSPLMRLRYWLVLVGAVIGFVLGSSVQVAQAQLSQAVEYENRGDLDVARADYASAVTDFSQSLRNNTQS